MDPFIESESHRPFAPSRREFVAVAVSFAAGGACSTLRTPAGSDNERGEAAGGDAVLAELQRLATRAPIDELMNQRLVFVAHVARTHPDEPVLWDGMRRLCDEVVANPAVPDRRRFARYLAQIEGARTPLAKPLLDRCPRLREVQ